MIGASVDVQDADRRAVELAEAVAASGEVADPVWRELFARVPRHVFVPSFARTSNTSEGVVFELVRGDDPAQREDWLLAVYSDQTLIIQIDGRPVEEILVPHGRGRGTWTSSSTLPSLMARLLEELQLEDSSRVLEIGTGSGYNAAILATRLGADHVTSVDISPQLVERARGRLGLLGLRPTLAAVDGHGGFPANAPYDRILATCATTHIPRSWVEQTRPGGVIIANLAGELGAGAMVHLTVGEGGRANGRFLKRWAGFMTAQTAGSSVAPEADLDVPGVIRPTELNPDVLSDMRFAFFAEFYAPHSHLYRARTEDGRRIVGLIDRHEGSWAEVLLHDDGSPECVEQNGPRKLWDLVEKAHRDWLTVGQPGWEKFGLLVTSDSQYVWLDDPIGPMTWTLPLR